MERAGTHFAWGVCDRNDCGACCVFSVLFRMHHLRSSLHVPLCHMLSSNVARDAAAQIQDCWILWVVLLLLCMKCLCLYRNFNGLIMKYKGLWYFPTYHRHCEMYYSRMLSSKKMLESTKIISHVCAYTRIYSHINEKKSSNSLKNYLMNFDLESGQDFWKLLQMSLNITFIILYCALI